MKQILLFAMLCIATLGYAQEDITVSVVVAASSKAVPGAVITLNNQSRGIIQQSIANEQGSAIFHNLPAINGYQISYEGDVNFAAQTTNMIDIRSNQNATVTLALQPSSLQGQKLDEVTINSNTSGKINTRDAEVSFELKSDEIHEIPVEGRDITRVLFRLPNVTQATGFYAEAPNVSINGANGLFASYLIDGMDNNERFLGGQKFSIPTGFAKDVTVLTSNFSAEYGLTGSGIVNVTTRSGSNDVKGEVFFITRPGPAIDGKSQFAQRDLSGNQVKNGFARYQAGAGVGGAFAKNKTFYYFNYEHTTDVKDNLLNVPQLGINSTVRGSNNFDLASAKIDQIWNDRFRTSLRANVGIIGIERQGGGLDGGVNFPSATNTQDRNSTLIALNNNYSKGNFSGETNIQYARFRWNYAKAKNPNSPQVTVLDDNDQPLAILGNPGYVFDEIENTFQFQQKIKYYLDKHTIKAGIGLIHSEQVLFGGGNPNGNYTVKLTPAQLATLRASNPGQNLGINDIPSDATVTNFNVELRPTSFGANQDIYSGYLEDLWAVTPKLNLTLGLRYDYDNLSKGGSDKGDYNNLAPRLNFNYKINNRSTFRGGYGIAYDKINYGLYSDALQQNTNSDDYKAEIQKFIDLGILPQSTDINKVTFAGNISANASSVPYLNGPTAGSLEGQRDHAFSNERRILNPNGYDNPYHHQISIGYQLQVGKDKLFFVDLVHNRGEKLFRLRNLNAASDYVVDPNNVIVRTPAEADATRPVPIVAGGGLINGTVVAGVARNVVMTETAGESRYYAASFNFQKLRADDNYDYRINYTLSQLKNNTEDINFRAMDGNNYGQEWGPSINDRTHNINGIFNYYPIKNGTLTLAGLLQSGQPINRIPLGFGTTDLNGDGSSFGDAYQGNSDRFPGESRNSDRLPWSFNFDVGVQYQIPLGGTYKVELRADIFNIFNVENLSGYSNNATQSNQIQGGSSASGLFTQRNAGPPRQFQFGARFLF